MKLSATFVLLAVAGFSAAQDIDVQGGFGFFPIPISKRPLVVSSLLQSSIKSSNLLTHARKFTEFSKLSNGTRAFGSAGHNATVKYIKAELDKTGYYDTELQTFPYLYSQGTAAFSANGTDYATAWFTYGPGGEVTAPLVVVNNLGCTLEDYPASVVGKIALVKRGECTFGLKTALSGASGAAGVIIYNNADGAVGGGTLGDIVNPAGPYVPGASLTGIDGSALVATINAGSEVIGTIKVEAVTEDRYSSNVIATTKIGDRKNIVFAGGHSDSVPAGPGINDDGSGTMGILEVALKLASYKVNNAVRFGFWTAEEFGLVGSEYYVQNLPEAERQKIALYLNFDMIASPNIAYLIYDGDGSAFNLTGPAGSDKIEKLFEDFYKVNKVRSAPTEFSGRSDYGPFLDVGIPAGGIFSGAEGLKTAEQAKWWGGEAGVSYDPCYHKACDNIANLNVPAWVLNTKAAAHSIATYARSLSGIPRTRKSTASAELRVAGLSYDDRRHFSCGHEIAAL
ncbi:putative leucine aminopeptidase 2 [Psilocybe cubensis]|uniref:Leucine aminopeptidase 2 n=2 Tax=Psilocybe cubensis TaxID=181762 RepID=A0ACB8GVL0_PSICU|nr:putative leucine aminopeptidase 2 [Psilocybe cubensis]KAH9479763.1 putative leucine aminopeptidase 2 [Psilocybe cubensis]